MQKVLQQTAASKFMYKISKPRVVNCLTILHRFFRVDECKEPPSHIAIYMTFSNFHETWDFHEKTAFQEFCRETGAKPVVSFFPLKHSEVPQVTNEYQQHSALPKMTNEK